MPIILPPCSSALKDVQLECFCYCCCEGCVERDDLSSGQINRLHRQMPRPSPLSSRPWHVLGRAFRNAKRSDKILTGCKMRLLLIAILIISLAIPHRRMTGYASPDTYVIVAIKRSQSDPGVYISLLVPLNNNRSSTSKASSLTRNKQDLIVRLTQASVTFIQHQIKWDSFTPRTPANLQPQPKAGDSQFAACRNEHSTRGSIIHPGQNQRNHGREASQPRGQPGQQQGRRLAKDLS